MGEFHCPFDYDQTKAALLKLAEEFSDAHGEELGAQARYLAKQHPARGKTADEVRDYHLKNNKGEKVSIEDITDYGAVNPQEAFAEAFRLYVTKGPAHLGPWTRQFFKDIVESGGAKLRSSVR